MDEKRELIKAMLTAEYYPVVPEEKFEISNVAIQFPIAELSTLGTAFATISESCRTISQTVNFETGETLYRAVIKEGVSGTLATKGGITLGNIIGDGGKIVSRARFEQVPSVMAGTVQTATMLNPALVFIAGMLMSIEKRLAHIMEIQEEMLEFLYLKENVKLRANLTTLSDILNNYKYNWDNEKYKSNKHILVQEIKRDSEKSILLFRELIKGKLKKKGFLVSDRNIKTMLDKVLKEFEEYRLAVYLYSFSSYLETVLLENFDKGYLDSIVKKMEGYSIEYRETYTKCYDEIEKHSKSSLESQVLGVLGGVSKVAGDTISKIPVVSKSKWDTSLIQSGENLEKLNSQKRERIMKPLISSQSSFVRPFIDNVNTLNRLYNEPINIAFDSKNLYLG